MRYVPLLAISAYIAGCSGPAFAAPPSQETLNLICSASFGPFFQEAYKEKDKYITPIFDEATDAKLLKLQESMASQDTKALFEFQKVAVPIYLEKMKDELQVCHSLMKIKAEVCGDDFIKNDCDKDNSKRADGRALFATFKDQLRARFLRPKEIGDVSGSPDPFKPQPINRFAFHLTIISILMAIFIFVKILGRKKFCPDCGNKLPTFRVPTDVYELLAGGWTCQKCGAKLTFGLKKRS